VDLVLQLLATGLVVGSLYALCAIGWGLIYGTTLHFHVAHGAVFALAAYYAYVGQQLLHLPLVVAVPAGALACGCSGAAAEGVTLSTCCASVSRSSERFSSSVVPPRTLTVRCKVR